MDEVSGETIAFDVLLRGRTDDVDVASVTGIDSLRPPPDNIERCFRWLSEQGVTCHRTDFGLGCEAEVTLFESLFSVRVVAERTSRESPPTFTAQGTPQPPPAIAKVVSQITVARPPTLFG